MIAVRPAEGVSNPESWRFGVFAFHWGTSGFAATAGVKPQGEVWITMHACYGERQPAWSQP
jgi:hypothetical protein